MSASERLRALDEVMTPRPWSVQGFDIHGEGVLLGYGATATLNDVDTVTILRNALPQICALVEAAEGLYVFEVESNDWYDIYESLPSLLAALNEALGEQ